MTGEIFSAESFMWSCLWQSTIFLAAGPLGSFLLRRHSARAHRVLFLSMIAAVIVPAASILVKHYELGLFAAEPIAIQPSSEAHVIHEATGNISNEDIERSPAPINQDLQPAMTGSKAAKFPWSLALLYTWIAVSLILAVRLLVTFVLGVRILHSAMPLDCGKIEQAIDQVKTKLGIRKQVKIYTSVKISSPVIWCWRSRPVLLVPSTSARSVNKIDWTGVLCHELAHYKRQDHVAGLLAELTVCILPWHPLLWLAKSRLISLSEQACDDWVVASGQPGTDYAESLLNLMPERQMAFVPAVVTSKRGLPGRVRRILKDRCSNPRTGIKWTLVVTLITVCLTVGAALAQTRPAKPQTAGLEQDISPKSLFEVADADDTRINLEAIPNKADQKIDGHNEVPGKTIPTEQEFTKQKTITGVVRDEQDKPVKGVTLRLLPYPQDFTSNAEGKFEIYWDPQRWGPIDITVYLVAQHEQRNLAAIVELDKDVGTLDIKLKPGVVLFGKVTDPEGKGIIGAWIMPTLRLPMVGLSMVRPQQKRTYLEGNFEVKAMPTGYKYSLWVSADGYGSKSSMEIQTDNLTADSRFDIGIITLPVANLSVSGIVVDANDKPVADAAVISEGEGQPNHSKRSYADGKFTFEKVCDGRIRINANTYGTTPLHGSVDTYGGATDVKIVVTEQGTHSFVPKQPPSLVGSNLPGFQGFGIVVRSNDLKDKKILLCFWDMQQRPSRNYIEYLTKRKKMLDEKNVVVLLVNTSKVEPAKLKELLDNRNIPFACGSIKNDTEKVLFTWGVRAQPWLILTDKEGVVRAEGLNLEQLDQNLKHFNERK